MSRRGGLLSAPLALLALVATACAPVAADRLHTCGRGADTRACAFESAQAIDRALGARLRPPPVAGSGSIAPEPPAGSRPSRAPRNAGGKLVGHPVPTNTWWTSALVGPWSEPLLAGPLAVQVTESGVAVAYQPPVVTRDHVVQPFEPALLVPGPLEDLHVVGYGAFDVVLESRFRAGGSVRVRVVQGSPLVQLDFRGGARPAVRLLGSPRKTGLRGGRLSSTLGGQRWDVVAPSGSWKLAGPEASLLADERRDVSFVVAAAPDEAGAAWNAVLARAARDPIVETTESLSYDPARGAARQVLTVRRARGGAGPWALTPLQRRHAVGSPRRLAGSFAGITGPMPVVEARSLTLEAALPGFLPGVPRLPLGRAARNAVQRGLERDLAQTPSEGGSYFGLKELGREAALMEVAAALDDRGALRRSLRLLEPRIVDWLTYSGASDARYFAYDATWGGLVPVPAEFGAEDYNDHHLQYGYLVRAAAVLAEHDAAFGREYGEAVNAVVRDFAGGTADSVAGGFPSERVWDAGVEHSWASGFAPFADGNNQESSSEAVAAWSAVARWGLATGQKKLAELGLARYAFEAAAARAYWLGEPRSTPRGYEHRVVGIVWGGKLDHATWFSPAPAAIHGIQLLPVGFDVLYREHARGARERITALRRETGGAITQWGDLFATELALFDPRAARAQLSSSEASREPSTSRALVRYLVEALALGGPPDRRVRASAAYGLALGRAGRIVAIAVNPTGRERTVTFRLRSRVIARVRVAAGASAYTIVRLR